MRIVTFLVYTIAVFVAWATIAADLSSPEPVSHRIAHTLLLLSAVTFLANQQGDRRQ